MRGYIESNNKFRKARALYYDCGNYVYTYIDTDVPDIIHYLSDNLVTHHDIKPHYNHYSGVTPKNINEVMFDYLCEIIEEHFYGIH